MVRIFNHYISLRVLMLTGIEAAVLFASILIGLELRLIEPLPPIALLHAALFSVAMLTSMSALGLYESFVAPLSATVSRLLIAFVLSCTAILLAFGMLPTIPVGRGLMAWSALLGLTSLLLVRLICFYLTDLGLPKRRVLVLGNGSEAEQVISQLNAGGLKGAVQYVGLYPVSPEQERRFDHEQMLRTAAELKVTEMVVAVKERRGGVLPLRQLLDAKLRGIHVVDLHSFYEREQGILRLDSMRASWMIFGDGFAQSPWRALVKRCFDLLVSASLLVLTLPVLVIAMAAIAWDSPGGIFYRQERVGEAGRRFWIRKLRTMRSDAEADGRPQWAGVNDPRITRIGAFLRKSRIDELPQLWNVLCGEMSFVGPRPERPFFVEALTERIPFYQVRHSIRPGITGWSQVRYPYGASESDALNKLQYDLYYVKNHSLFLDLLILVETIQVVLMGRGAR